MPRLRKRPDAVAPTSQGWKNAKLAPPGYRYASMVAAAPDICQDKMSGMEDSAIYEKYIFLCAKPFTMGSLHVMLSNTGAKAAQHALAKLHMSSKAHNARTTLNASKPVKARGGGRVSTLIPEVVEEITSAPLQAVKAQAGALAQRMRQLGEKHIGRMTKQVNKVHKVLDERELHDKNLGRHLSELDKFDQVARRTFQMDDGEQMTPQQFNVGMLVNLTPDMLKQASEPLEGCFLAPQLAQDASEPSRPYQDPQSTSDAL